MNAEAERTLNNLNVLAAISHNDKLMTNEDNFDIYSPTTLRALYRTWYGERRTQNVERVRHAVRSGVGHATSTLEEAMQLVETPQELGLRLKVHNVAMQCVRIVDALSTAVQGLTNLMQTYRNDAALASQIRLLTVEIKDFLTVVQPHIVVLREKVSASISEASSPSTPPRYPPHENLPPLIVLPPSQAPARALPDGSVEPRES